MAENNKKSNDNPRPKYKIIKQSSLVASSSQVITEANFQSRSRNHSKHQLHSQKNLDVEKDVNFDTKELPTISNLLFGKANYPSMVKWKKVRKDMKRDLMKELNSTNLIQEENQLSNRRGLGLENRSEVYIENLETNKDRIENGQEKEKASDDKFMVNTREEREKKEIDDLRKKYYFKMNHQKLPDKHKPARLKDFKVGASLNRINQFNSSVSRGTFYNSQNGSEVDQRMSFSNCKVKVRTVGPISIYESIKQKCMEQKINSERARYFHYQNSPSQSSPGLVTNGGGWTIRTNSNWKNSNSGTKMEGIKFQKELTKLVGGGVKTVFDAVESGGYAIRYKETGLTNIKLDDEKEMNDIQDNDVSDNKFGKKEDSNTKIKELLSPAGDPRAGISQAMRKVGESLSKEQKINSNLIQHFKMVQPEMTSNFLYWGFFEKGRDFIKTKKEKTKMIVKGITNYFKRLKRLNLTLHEVTHNEVFSKKPFDKPGLKQFFDHIKEGRYSQCLKTLNQNRYLLYGYDYAGRPG